MRPHDERRLQRLLDTPLYHGCSRAVANRIADEGFAFAFNNPNYARWLCAYGLYLFVDNPLLAYAFAQEKATWPMRISNATGRQPHPADTEPVVLQVSLDNSILRSEVLDLTTAEGMQRVFTGHMELHDLLRFHVQTAYELATDPQPGSDEVAYYESLDMLIERYTPSPQERQVQSLWGALASKNPSVRLDELLRRAKKIVYARNRDLPGSDELNYDCMVITDLVDETHYGIVTAAIQMGDPYHALHHHDFHVPGTFGYKGIRTHDHVELCVTAPSFVKSFSVYEDFDPTFFERTFRDHVVRFDHFRRESD